MAARIEREDLCFVRKLSQQWQVGAGGKAGRVAEQQDRRAVARGAQPVERQAEPALALDRNYLGELIGNGYEVEQKPSPEDGPGRDEASARGILAERRRIAEHEELRIKRQAGIRVR